MSSLIINKYNEKPLEALNPSIPCNDIIAGS